MCKMAVTAFVFFFSAAVSANAACSDPAGPGVDWSGCVLTHAYLYDANLSGADLSGARKRRKKQLAAARTDGKTKL